VKAQEGFPFKRVAIVGPGLMGGSLALALKKLPDPPHIRALSRDPEEIRLGVRAGALDEGATDPEGLLWDRDLVAYATPLEATLLLMEEHREFLQPRTLVTDLVSLKIPILRKAADLDLQDRFVGSHPMVGGTGSGFSAASGDLYSGARVWLVPGESGPSSSVESIRAFWSTLGAFPVEIGPEEHDVAMTWVSHLPQLTSNALALTLKRGGYLPRDLGSGGRDMTRLAGSGPEMWRDLIGRAPESVIEALGDLEMALGELRTLLRQRDVEGVVARMEETRDWMGGDS